MRNTRLSSFLIAIVLSPALLQSSGDCGSPGDPRLASLEVDAGGRDRIVGFSPSVVNYAIWLDGGPTMTVRARSMDPQAVITWDTGSDATVLGTGQGETSLPVTSELHSVELSVRTPGGARRSYTVRIEPPCTTGDCDDANDCTIDTCDTDNETCEFVAAPYKTICDFDYVGDGICGYGNAACFSNTIRFGTSGLASAEHTDADGDGAFEGFEDRAGGTITTEVFRVDADDPGSIRRGTLEYDVSSIPIGSEIVLAELYLNVSRIRWLGGIELEIATYAADGVPTSGDATIPAEVQDALIMSPDLTETVADVTDGVAQLFAAGESIVGLRMQLASEVESNPVDQSVTIYGLDWPSVHSVPMLFVTAIRHPCGGACNDGNVCTTDSCNVGAEACEYTAVSDGTTCDFESSADGVCDAGHCAPAGAILETIDAPGLVNATFVDNDYDGEFDTMATVGLMRVWARRVDFLGQDWTHRTVIEFDVTALPPGARIVNANFHIEALGASYGSGFDVELRGYAGDGSATMSDAEAGPTVDASFRIGRGQPIFVNDVDATNLVRGLVSQGVDIVGIALRADSESAVNSTDDEFVFPSLGSSAIRPPPTLSIRYAE